MALRSGKTAGPSGYRQNFIRNLKMSSNQFKYLKNIWKRPFNPPCFCSSVGFTRRYVLSRCLGCPLPEIIWDDQTAFIKDRHSFFFFNIRQLAGVDYSPSASPCPEVAISFYQVRWAFFFFFFLNAWTGQSIYSLVEVIISPPSLYRLIILNLTFSH